MPLKGIFPEVVALFFISYCILTISEPLVFQNGFPEKNLFLLGSAAVGLWSLACSRSWKRPLFLCILSFFLISLLNVFIQKLTIIDIRDYIGVSPQEFGFSVLKYSAFSFCAGLSLPILSRSRLAGPIAVVGAVVSVFLFASRADGMTIWWWKFTYLDGTRPSHLSVDDALILLFFISFANVRSGFRYVLAAGLLFCLILSGSRSSLILAIIAFAGYSILSSQTTTGWLRIFLSFFLLTFAAISNSKTVNAIFDRMLPSGFGNDDSLMARVLIFRQSEGDLMQQFITGDPTLIVSRLGTVGLYIHNILSAWQFYGFLAFAALSAGIMLASVKMMSHIRRHRTLLEPLGFLLLVYATFGIMTSKCVGLYSLWWALGYWAALPSSRGEPVDA